MIAFVNRLLTSRLLQRWINQNEIARILGRLADSRRLPRWLLKKIIKAYIENFNIDMTEYICDVDSVDNFNQFFTRTLKPGSRAIAEGIVSPVDGYITQLMNIDNEYQASAQLLQVKGKNFLLEDLIAEKPRFRRGCYSIIYLSPADYHRFHAPFDFILDRIHYIPGELLATNTQALTVEDRIYCRNERIVLSGTSEWGDFYFVAVGATAVGRVSLSFYEIHTNIKRAKEAIISDGFVNKFCKGQELGFFELGSTVVLVINNECVSPVFLGNHRRVKMGETLWNQ